jgi:hypothetical protein
MEPLDKDDMDGFGDGGGDGNGNNWLAMEMKFGNDDGDFFNSLWFLLILAAIVFSLYRYKDDIKDYVTKKMRGEEVSFEEKSKRYTLTTDDEESKSSLGHKLKNLAEKSKEVVKKSFEKGKESIKQVNDKMKKKNDPDLEEGDCKLLGSGDGIELD